MNMAGQIINRGDHTRDGASGGNQAPEYRRPRERSGDGRRVLWAQPASFQTGPPDVFFDLAVVAARDLRRDRSSFFSVGVGAAEDALRYLIDYFEAAGIDCGLLRG